MKQTYICIGLLLFSGLANAQMKLDLVSDTLKIQQIEDVQLHKTGNPNKARLQAGKSQLTIMETPQAVSIVTHEIIEQQQAKQLSDVLQNVNGLYVTSSRGSSQDSFGARGFTFGSDNIFKNGTRVNSGVFPEVSGLERVEVLKGSNAMLYGNTAAGGIVNLVTKKPRFEQGGSVSFNAGSWNSYKPTVDFYGPLSKTIAFRVDGSYETSESFRDVVKNKKYYFNPSFVFNIGENTQVIVEGDYLKNDFTPDFGLGTIKNKDGTFKINDILDRSDFVGANWQYQNVQQTTTDVVVNHQFNDNWTLNAVLAYQNYIKDYYSTERLRWTYDSNDRLSLERPLNRYYQEQNYTSAQFNFNGNFNTGKVKHQILIGTDGDFLQADTYGYDNPTSYGTNGNLVNTKIYMDDPSSWASGAIPVANKINRNRIPTQRFGVYAQDFVNLTSKFKILAGLRYSYIENKESEKKTFATNKTVNSAGTVDRAFSPKFGAVYMPNENLSFYGTYTNSFSANTGSDINLNSLKPSIIDQYEIGLKKNFWNNAVALNVTVYQIINQNYYQTAEFNAQGNPNSDSSIKEFAGKLKSQGVELDVTGNPSKNLSIIAGFSYNHSVYKDTPANFGYVENQRSVRTPATTANASVFYTFTNQLKGFKAGASVYFIGDRIAGYNDTKASLAAQNQATRLIPVKDYATVALSAGYEFKKFSIMGKVGNLFDVINYNVHESYSVNPITPRNFYFTLTYKL
ncbi:TonB-dependent siderophore receptor [Halpernia sp.]|uniref:TonB-dependent siderophore receptor n=1 Tax=Halpernia sp. TaxID=2782209 RepID=UPI003A93B2B4